METAQRPANSVHRARVPSESLRCETAQNSERAANERSISTDTGKKRRRAPRNARLPAEMRCRQGPLCRNNLSMKNGAILAWIAGTRKIRPGFDRGPLGCIRATPPYAGDTRRGEQSPERSDVLVLIGHRG